MPAIVSSGGVQLRPRFHGTSRIRRSRNTRRAGRRYLDDDRAVWINVWFGHDDTVVAAEIG